MGVSAGRGKLDGIEACRGLAALAVVLYHAARHLHFNYGLPSLAGFFQFGHAGVDLFFVISGFIILYVHYDDIGRPWRIAHYLERRFTRVMPTYWVALALTVALAVAGRIGLPSLSDLVRSATLVPSDREPLLYIAWTLQYEITFYVLFCALLLHRTIGILVLSLWLCGILLTQVHVIDATALPQSLFNAFNLEFFFGMMVAYAMRHAVVPAPRLILFVGTLLFAVAAVGEDLAWYDGYAGIARMIYGPPAALIVLGAAAAGRQTSMTVPAVLRTLGAASYSIYLFQFIFIGVIWQVWLAIGLDRLTPHAASYPLLVVAAVTGGVVVSRCIEHPLIRLTRERLIAATSR